MKTRAGRLQQHASLGEKGDTVSVSHRSKFDADQVKIDLGLDLELTSFRENVERLASAKISIVDASVFFMKVYFPAEFEKGVNPRDLESTQARNKHDPELRDLLPGPCDQGEVYRQPDRQRVVRGGEKDQAEGLRHRIENGRLNCQWLGASREAPCWWQ